MTENEVKKFVLETLQEAISGSMINEPIKTPDGDEYNNYVFDSEAFYVTVQKMLRNLTS